MSQSSTNTAALQAITSSTELTSLVFTPSWRHFGHVVLSGRAVLNLRAAVDMVADAMEALTGRRLDHRPVGQSWEPQRAALCIRLTSGASASPLLLLFDACAVRELIDAITLREAGLRGHGPPGPLELGILEYALAECLDRVVERRPEWGSVRLSSFTGEMRSLDELSLDAKAMLGFEFKLVSGWGRVLAGPFANGNEAAPGTSEADEHREIAATTLLSPPPPGEFAPWEPQPRRLRVHLRLRPIAVSPDERGALSTGDVLMTGCTDLDSLGGAGELVSDTGWRLCSATIVKHHGHFIAIRCGRLDPQPVDVPGEHGNACHVTARIGSAVVTEETLQDWNAGAVLDLLLERERPVEISTSDAHRAAGELIRFDGEIGIRLLETPCAARGHDEPACLAATP